MWARRTRVLVIGGIITLGLLATVLVQSPPVTQTVDELMVGPDHYVGEEVAIRGEVRDGSIENSSMIFVLEGETSSLVIHFSNAAVSNGLDDNRTVYAEGILRYDEGSYFLEADVIKTSCPSKYEEVNDEA